jgi:RNA polymerase sigma-54 factor
MGETVQLRANVRTQQKQSAAISAQVIQSIQVLQYGLEELQTFLSEQAERNPLVEIVGGRDSEAPRAAPLETGSSDLAGAQPAGEALEQLGDRYTRHPVDTRSGELSAGRGVSAAGGRDAGGHRHVGSGDAYNLEEVIASSVSLADHLGEQVALTFDLPAERIIAGEIVGSLDPNGYLRRDLWDIADMLGVDEVGVEAVLTKVQTFDPIGVAARNLAECLKLQLDETGRLDPPMETLLKHLPLLARYEIQQLSRLCGVDEETLLLMAKEIRELDPRPGRRFDTTPVLPALPDILVEMLPDGSCAVEINSDLLPRVLVNQRYYAEIVAGPLGQQDKVFVTDCLQNASWLARNVEQRTQTILKVATEIVMQQRDFLLYGIEHLRPLNLKDVAKVLGMHESTVCRAVANKFMMTNRGMFDLKFFFSNSIATADGGADFSTETIRHRIRLMISAESATDVLSDDAIVTALRKEGVEIARRTVAKYREMMHIASSDGRRRRNRAEQVGKPTAQEDGSDVTRARGPRSKLEINPAGHGRPKVSRARREAAEPCL